MVNIAPTLNEFTWWLSKSGKELWSWPTSVADAIGETFTSVKDRASMLWSESYGKSLTEQFANNSEDMKKNLAVDGWILSKSYSRVKWALNWTMGRIWAWTKWLAQGTWRLPKQLLTHGMWAGVDLAVKLPVKVVWATTWSLVSSAGELLAGTGKTMKKWTDVTRKLIPDRVEAPPAPIIDSKVKTASEVKSTS